MLMDHTAFFDRYFPLLTGGNSAYHWQEAFFAQMVSGDVPDSLDLPTGAGKTSIIPIWLLALAWTSFANPAARLPRRLIWVVNRRVVVDQATEEAISILKAVTELPEAGPLHDALTALSGSACPLAVSTLRGERADNRDWSRNPAVPAIVVGTVDMIGSRLLFRGYGDSAYRRPQQAALLAVDSLIVNDEAHLTPAFARLLLAIREVRPAAHTPFGFHIMLVSATDRGLGSNPFKSPIDVESAATSRFRCIYEAEKRLWLQPAPDAQTAARLLLSLALKDPAPRTIVFIEEPEKARDVAASIAKTVGAERVTLLTGTLRGRERDDLTLNAAFRAFQVPDLPDEPVFLVATSAAEVGVNLTSERLLTLLAPADRLCQRFGRLNRFGDQDGEPHRIGDAYVVFLEPSEKYAGTPRAHALQYLSARPVQPGGWRDISCRALRENPAPPEACEPDPAIAPLHPWHLDLWAQTSIGNDVLPAVEPWLHGKQDDVPETFVTWRAEVKWLAVAEIDSEDRSRAIDGYPLLSHEKLREPAHRVKEKLAEIATSTPGTLALLVSTDGAVIPKTVAELAGLKLAYCTVILPPGCGGLDRGMFTPQPTPGVPYDVADRTEGPARRRYHVTFLDDEWQWTPIDCNDPAEPGPSPADPKQLRDFAARHGLGAPTVIEIPGQESEDSPADCLVLFAPKLPDRPAATDVDLDDHTASAVRHSEALAAILFPGPAVAWFREAARLHDLGKQHPLWRFAMGCETGSPKAKVVRPRNPRLLAGFRHELHSLVLAQKETTCDPVLHLIGSHHGRGRPHWEARAYDPVDPTASETAALEAARRFGLLQLEFGHWGLAYLETVFKAIDAMASAEGKND